MLAQSWWKQTKYLVGGEQLIDSVWKKKQRHAEFRSIDFRKNNFCCVLIEKLCCWRYHNLMKWKQKNKIQRGNSSHTRSDFITGCAQFECAGYWGRTGHRFTAVDLQHRSISSCMLCTDYMCLGGNKRLLFCVMHIIYYVHICIKGNVLF